MLAAGMKPITFSSEDAKRYVEVAEQAMWQEVRRVLPPEESGKVIDFLSKK
jgi:hypothetical protein